MPTDVDAPICLPLPDVLRRLRVGRTKMNELLAAGVFTVIDPDGRGVGKRLFLRTAEVEVYDATRSPAAVRAFRERQGGHP